MASWNVTINMLETENCKIWPKITKLNLSSNPEFNSIEGIL